MTPEEKNRIEIGLDLVTKRLAEILGLDATNKEVLEELFVKVQCYGVMDIAGKAKMGSTPSAEEYLEKCTESILNIQKNVEK